MKSKLILLTALAALLAAPVASAHVTLNPNEWEAGGFARFAVRVPNESAMASTTEVTMQFPENVISARFQDVPGWERTIQMATLDTPIEEEGEEPITERLASVTWSGGEIEPGEFQEFGVSFQVPEGATEPLLFPTLQTYSDGEVARWIAPEEEADTPAPRVAVLAVAGEEPATTDPTETITDEGAAAAAAGGSESGGDGEDRANLALVLGIAGLIAGLAALGVALSRPRRTTTEVGS
ncbi:MAG: YcnI family protein [Actinobacteria bacterium]|nr:YcnI family protein [Actinomycetota bacterium]